MTDTDWRERALRAERERDSMEQAKNEMATLAHERWAEINRQRDRAEAAERENATLRDTLAGFEKIADGYIGALKGERDAALAALRKIADYPHDKAPIRCAAWMADIARHALAALDTEGADNAG